MATQAGATTQIVESTLDLNTTAGSGGGIYNLGHTFLLRTLVQQNTAAGGGNIFTTLPETVDITGSVIRNGRPNNCALVNTIPGCAN